MLSHVAAIAGAEEARRGDLLELQADLRAAVEDLETVVLRLQNRGFRHLSFLFRDEETSLSIS